MAAGKKVGHTVGHKDIRVDLKLHKGGHKVGHKDIKVDMRHGAS